MVVVVVDDSFFREFDATKLDHTKKLIPPNPPPKREEQRPKKRPAARSKRSYIRPPRLIDWSKCE